MNQQLQIKENMFYVIFHDNSKLKITERQHEYILNIVDNKASFSINNCLYKSTAIAKIISEEEYLEQYPSKKETGRIFKNTYPSFDWKKVNSKKALGQLISGLKRFISEQNNPTLKADELLHLIQNKFNLKFNT